MIKFRDQVAELFVNLGKFLAELYVFPAWKFDLTNNGFFGGFLKVFGNANVALDVEFNGLNGAKCLREKEFLIRMFQRGKNSVVFPVFPLVPVFPLGKSGENFEKKIRNL